MIDYKYIMYVYLMDYRKLYQKYKKDKEELKKKLSLKDYLKKQMMNQRKKKRRMIVNIFTEKLITLLPEETSRSKTILRRIKDN